MLSVSTVHFADDNGRQTHQDLVRRAERLKNGVAHPACRADR